MNATLVENVSPHILRDAQNMCQANSAFRALRVTQPCRDNGSMNIGDEIRRRRKALKWSLEKLANLVDTDTGNLSRLERGKQGYSDEMIRKVADALGCSVSDLFATLENSNIAAFTPPGFRRIPLIDSVQAGTMTEATDPFEIGGAFEWLLTDLDISTRSFALRIKGDSMLPEFREGDIILVDPAVEPLPGDFVVAKNGENEATFKKYRPRGINERGEKVFLLTPLNDDYESMQSDITPIKIIGTMIEHRRFRRK